MRLGDSLGSVTDSTFHLCRLIKLEDPNRENWPLCIMKRVAFTYEKARVGASNEAAVSNARKYDQIRT